MRNPLTPSPTACDTQCRVGRFVETPFAFARVWSAFGRRWALRRSLKAEIGSGTRRPGNGGGREGRCLSVFLRPWISSETKNQLPNSRGPKMGPKFQPIPNSNFPIMGPGLLGLMDQCPLCPTLRTHNIITGLHAPQQTMRTGRYRSFDYPIGKGM